jgi:HAD superfamily hydrolase (TIGR01509 family)
MIMIKAVIFDKDGVMIDSEYANIQSAVKAFKQLGITIDENEQKQIVGKHPDDYSLYFLTKYKFSYPEFRKIQRQFYYQIYDQVPLFDKTIALINQIKKAGLKLALTTTSSITSTDMVIKRAKLESVFDVVVTNEQYSQNKPHPEPYLITAQKLDMKPNECLVVEDSVIGMRSAKSAGMKCIIIKNRFTKDQDFSQADMVVNNGDEINIEKIKNES